MNRSVGALCRSILAVVVLGLTALGSLLWSLGVITIDSGARVEPSSSPPMITELPKAPFEHQSRANNEGPTSEYRQFEYTGTTIDIWVEIERNGNWEEALRFAGWDFERQDSGSTAQNAGKNLNEKRADDQARVTNATAASPPSGSVTMATHLDESGGNLRMTVRVSHRLRDGNTVTSEEKMDLINHQLSLENPSTGWSSSSPPFPAVLTDELTVLTSEIKLREKDREFTRHIRLKVRPIKNIRSKN